MVAKAILLSIVSTIILATNEADINGQANFERLE